MRDGAAVLSNGSFAQDGLTPAAAKFPTGERKFMFMKPATEKKRSASFSYGIGVAQIVAGIPLAFLGLSLMGLVYAVFTSHGIGYSLLQIVLLTIVAGGTALIVNGAGTCGLVTRYQKIVALMGYNTRERLEVLAQATGQDLTALVRDLRKMADKGYFPSAYIDLAYREFAFEKANRPTPALEDGDGVLCEKVRPSFLTLLAFPAAFAAYAVVFPKVSWTGFIVAGSVSFAAFIIVLIKSPKVHNICEKKYKTPPQSAPEPVATGNAALDELLTTSMGYLGQLNELSLAITSEKMILPVGELLNISRQIFSFVEKQPEKIRQIRQFMNYYLPTTIKLLQSYVDFSREPLKGSNIKEAMAKIEGSMGGIVETFRRELDNLYRDRTDDITVDIDVMLALMRQQSASSDFPTDK